MQRVSLLFTVLLSFIIIESYAQKTSPNIIIVFIDDMAWGDVSINNSSIHYTPNFNRLAKGGVKLTNFYASQAICTASRSSLITGCYANRIGMNGALDHNAKVGLHPDETTIAEVLKNKGYKTAAVGKWHLGFQKQFLPTNQGFDEYFGIPYSADMWPYHPEKPDYYPPLPLYQNENIIDTIKDQSWLTSRFTEKAVDFISRNKSNPFFLYLAHPMPHVPLYVSDKFKNSTGKGLYADVIAEIDWSVGELLTALQKNKIEENTLIIVTSDNGPWLSYGNHSGNTAGLREGKGTSWEGGVREAFVAYWKGVLPAGKILNDPAMTIDLLPTIAAITESKLPAKKIDGVNIWPWLTGKVKSAPQRPFFFYYNRNDLQAMRWKNYKLYFPHTYRTMDSQVNGADGKPGKYRNVVMVKPELYDLSLDPFEKNNLAESNPLIVEKMNIMADEMRKELGDDLTKQKGIANRQAGRVE